MAPHCIRTHAHVHPTQIIRKRQQQTDAEHSPILIRLDPHFRFQIRMETRIVKSGVEGRERVEVRREIKRIVTVQLVVTAIVLSAKETSIGEIQWFRSRRWWTISYRYIKRISLKDRERISSSWVHKNDLTLLLLVLMLAGFATESLGPRWSRHRNRAWQCTHATRVIWAFQALAPGRS